ncbi:Uncharacterized protein APZ42_020401 [Daphnia magna]|uniref:Uncharacterized protein n=1 Tax=Daphnia magna TaxID=35525 RepID=A0A164XIV2_9CRUS|nr:Uncharacterized protein APZ42_020401 [Daphnia magna]
MPTFYDLMLLPFSLTISTFFLMLTFTIRIAFPVYSLETLFVNPEMKSSLLLAHLDEHLQLMRISHNI